MFSDVYYVLRTKGLWWFLLYLYGRVNPVEEVHSIPEPVVEKASAPEAVATDAAQKVEEKSKRFMIGKKASRKIQTENGLLIVDQGGEITEEVIQKAKLANKFVELTMSVQ